MKEILIFLGSSFKLMKYRLLIGDVVRRLNDQFIHNNIRLKLFIWEDYTVGYSGKHKQQEYIDEMVLPSQISIFLFRERIGKFTRMELEAKLANDKNAIFCFHIKDNQFNTNVLDELSQLNLKSIGISTELELDNHISQIINNYILTLLPSIDQNKQGVSPNEIYFYTTIPNDLPSFQEHIGTAFRDLDDTTMNEWNIHCILHPRLSSTLLDKTDHYFPILRKDMSIDEENELKYGISKFTVPNNKLLRMTVFQNNSILMQNKKIHDLLVGKGIFTDKIQTLNDVKWSLLKWILKYREKLFSSYTSNVETKNGDLIIDSKPIVNLSKIDESSNISSLSNSNDKLKEQIMFAISDHHSDSEISQLVATCNRNKSFINMLLEQEINNWLYNCDLNQSHTAALVDEIRKLDGIIKTAYYIEGSSNIIKNALLQKEKLIKILIQYKACPNKALLAVQLNLVSFYDSSLNSIIQSEEEDRLYQRIIDDASIFNIQDANVEMMRMNLANSYSRQEDFIKAKMLYTTAAQNLIRMNDGSVAMAKNITYVLTHLFHEELQNGTLESTKETLMMFQKHINSLDVLNDAFIIDRCACLTAELTMIDIEDNSSYDIVQTAEEYFKKANSLVSTIPDKMVYGDVFVYLPSMIARYYIDHYDNLNETDFIFRKVTYYLDKASTNAETLSLTNYEEGLFHQGEIMHNRGFFYAKSEDFWSNGINAYNDAISLRTRLYNLTKYPYYEPRIAQSKVNLGELQLQILKKSQTESNDAIPMSSILCALDNSQKAMDIYQRHILVGNMNSERPYYEALQLNATILDFMFVSDKKRKDIYDEMISKYSRCWEWNKANPTNSYRMTFIDYSGRRLLEFNVISIGEFNSVLTICKNAFNN